jgi:hypothetical protein
MRRITSLLVAALLLAEPAGAAIPPNDTKASVAEKGLADGVTALKHHRYALALHILQPFAERGYAAAQVNLGTLFLHGLGTQPDAEAARRWFEAAAAQGFGLAYGQLGALYQNGDGHPRDISVALHWSRGGATRGSRHAASLFGLGLLYQNGDGVTASDHTAANYYRMAAERGHGRAQFMLAVMYLQGRGVSKDLVESYRWFLLAQTALPPSHLREQAARAIRLLDTQLTSALTAAVRHVAQDWQTTE